MCFFLLLWPIRAEHEYVYGVRLSHSINIAIVIVTVAVQIALALAHFTLTHITIHNVKKQHECQEIVTEAKRTYITLHCFPFCMFKWLHWATNISNICILTMFSAMENAYCVRVCVFLRAQYFISRMIVDPFALCPLFALAPGFNQKNKAYFTHIQPLY